MAKASYEPFREPPNGACERERGRVDRRTRKHLPLSGRKTLVHGGPLAQEENLTKNQRVCQKKKGGVTLGGSGQRNIS